jgi:ABC-2 type transport system ATP-binding protein
VLLSTHQTEDVAALCERVVVLAGGAVRFDGAVTDLVATAEGQVWSADGPAPDSVVSWRTGTGKHHVVGGRPPPGAVPAEPTLEDAYLLMLGADARSARALT